MAEVRLHNNVAMPILGLGTSHSGGYSHDAVMYALKSCEYRLIDTARRYGNEENLQKAIEESGVPRENLFLATKLWPTDYGFQSTIDAFRLSRKRLGCEYLGCRTVRRPILEECGLAIGAGYTSLSSKSYSYYFEGEPKG